LGYQANKLQMSVKLFTFLYSLLMAIYF